MSDRQRRANWEKARRGAREQLAQSEPKPRRGQPTGVDVGSRARLASVLRLLRILRSSFTSYATRAELLDELDDILFQYDKKAPGASAESLKSTNQRGTPVP